MALNSTDMITAASRRPGVLRDAPAAWVTEEDLLAAGARHDLLAELDLLGLEPLAHARNVAGGKGDVVEAAGVLELLLGAAHHDAVARLARAQQMHGGHAA